MTQEQLAEISGMSRVTLARAELGSDPRLSTALRLAHALGVTVEDIWTDDGEPSAALLAAERRPGRRK
jgi:DNA-binding XRE family transcriptional regulator